MPMWLSVKGTQVFRGIPIGSAPTQCPCRIVGLGVSHRYFNKVVRWPLYTCIWSSDDPRRLRASIDG